MKYRLEIGLILFLILFFISIDTPFVYIGNIQSASPDLRTPAQYECIASSVPAMAQILVFSRSDGTFDWSTYNFLFTRSQYFLVPRVMNYTEISSTGMLAEFQWFLAVHMDAQALDPIIRQSGLQVVKSCDTITVLKSAE